VTSFHSWDEVEREVFDADDLEDIAVGARRMVAEARAHRGSTVRQLASGSSMMLSDDLLVTS
jgi:hypothetical protein